jgi:mycothiol synthase
MSTPTTFQLQPFTGAYLEGVLEALSNALTADPISRSLFVRKVLLDPNFDSAGAPVALHGERVVGFGLSIVRRVPLEDAPSDAGRGYITLLGVAPDAQKRGVGTALLDQMERYLRERGCTTSLISPYAPNYFTPGVDVSAYAPALDFFQKRGYAEVYRPIAMDANLLNLKTPLWVQEKEVTLKSEGVTIEPYRAELIPALQRFLRAEFVGDWQRFAREAILRIEQGDPPQRVWLAHTDSEVFGFSHYENERFGPIGVAQSQRGRGIGQALLYRTLHAMRAQGLHTAFFLWSDDRTADRLYREAGFIETRRWAVLKKELTNS